MGKTIFASSLNILLGSLRNRASIAYQGEGAILSREQSMGKYSEVIHGLAVIVATYDAEVPDVGVDRENNLPLLRLALSMQDGRRRRSYLRHVFEAARRTSDQVEADCFQQERRLTVRELHA